MIPEHTNTTTLGELCVLIVQVLGSTDDIHFGVVVLSCKQRGWEYHWVEGNVILCHELNEIHLDGGNKGPFKKDYLILTFQLNMKSSFNFWRSGMESAFLSCPRYDTQKK